MKLLLYLLFQILFSTINLYALEKNSLPETLKNASKLVEQQRATDALKLLSQFNPDSFTFAKYNYVAAKAYAQLGNIYKAIEHYRLAYIYAEEKALKEKILFERANTFSNNKHYDEAVICFKIFLQHFPESALRQDAYLGLAESLYSLGRFNEALVFFQKSGNSPKAIYGMADTLQAMGRIKEAHELYLEIINNEKGYARTQKNLYNIGENFRLMKKPSYAKVYLSMVEDYPIRYQAELARALIAVEEGLLEQALRHLELAKQSPDRIVRRKALLHLSDILMRTGKLQEAKERLLEIRKKYPYGKDYDEALLKLASIYKQEGEIFKAASILQELVFRKTPDKVALDELEILLEEAKKRSDQKFLNLWQAIGQWLLEPTRSGFITKIVKDLKPLGKRYIDVCKWLLRHGSEEEKKLATLLMAEFFAQMGDIKNSELYLQKVKKDSDHSDEFHRVNALLLSMKSEYDKSLRSLMKIRKLNSDDINLLIKLSSEITPTMQNLQNLINYLEEVVKGQRIEPRLFLLYADILYQRGRKRDALRYYKEALNTNGENKILLQKDIDWCLYRISELSDKQESEDAIRTLQRGKDNMSKLAHTRVKENFIDDKLRRLF